MENMERMENEEELDKIRRFSEADLPNALANEEGSERRIPHIPDDQPPEDYAGEDYQLERAIEVLRGSYRRAEIAPNAG